MNNNNNNNMFEKSIILWQVDVPHLKSFVNSLGSDGQEKAEEFLEEMLTKNKLYNPREKGIFHPFTYGILAIQTDDCLVMHYFVRTKLIKDPALPHLKASLGERLSIGQVTRKLTKSMEYYLKNWGERDMFVFYSGPYSVKDIGNHLKKFAYLVDCNVDFPPKDRELYFFESHLKVLTVSHGSNNKQKT